MCAPVPGFGQGKHYITIFMAADAPVGAIPQNLEPHKCEGWTWRTWANVLALPAEALFIPIVSLRTDFPSLFGPADVTTDAADTAADAADAPAPHAQIASVATEAAATEAAATEAAAAEASLPAEPTATSEALVEPPATAVAPAGGKKSKKKKK